MNPSEQLALTSALNEENPDVSCKGALGVYGVLPIADCVLQSLFEETLIFLHSYSSIGKWRELASYLGPGVQLT
ncbi:unnamed protein product [Ilex paraguariensis]|uniref:Uncharacterized protein n=1 Tax=Ilex paraguariensis TaxID=185542 RepID=A0ABC8TL39_9AQUA